jgi:integration host factor subunit alpha
MTLTKADIAGTVSQKIDLGQAQSSQVMETLFEFIKEGLESGEDVLISGFGKWSVKAKQERTGRNPQTGTPLRLAPRKVVRFKCPLRFKYELNRKNQK